MEQLLPSFPVLITILLFISVFWARTKLIRSNESSPNPPPGPWKLPFIGNLHQLLHPLFHHRLRDLAKKFGPVMQLQIGEVSTVIISSSEAAKEVLKTQEINFVDRPHLLVVSILLYNREGFGFAPYGDHWREVRKISILELLSAKRVRSFKSIREEEVTDFIGSIYAKEGSPINLSRMIFSLGNGIIARASIGKKCKTQEAFLPIVDELTEALGGLNMADAFPSSRFFHMASRVRSRLERMHREADEMLDSILSERRANSGLASKMGKNEADDLLGVLLNLQHHGNLESQLTTTSIKSIILEMFTGGGDTSSTTLEWAMSELIKNPRVMEKAQKEVRQVFDDIGTVPDETNLQDLKFLKVIIKETLRLHPPAPLILKKLIDESRLLHDNFPIQQVAPHAAGYHANPCTGHSTICNLQQIPRECRKRCEVHGYGIDVKSKVLNNAWAIGRDPSYWNEAEKFYPERFIDVSADFKGSSFEFIPFGAGKRMCPGMSFAIANIEFTLAQMLYHFDWKHAGGLKPENLDMTESFGGTVKRKRGLELIPISYRSLVR